MEDDEEKDARRDMLDRLDGLADDDEEKNEDDTTQPTDDEGEDDNKEEKGNRTPRRGRRQDEEKEEKKEYARRRASMLAMGHAQDPAHGHPGMMPGADASGSSPQVEQADPLLTPWTAYATNGSSRPRPAGSPFPWWFAQGGDADGPNPAVEAWIGRRIDQIAVFADWLCSVDQEMDDVLLKCWLNHPFLVLTMDSLFTLWHYCYGPSGGGQGPTTFLSYIDSHINWIRHWEDATSRTPGEHVCTAADMTPSDARIERWRFEAMAGVTPIRAWAWPPTQARADGLSEYAADNAFPPASTAPGHADGR